MDNKGIRETLKNHKCLTCDNLTYWDWYGCKLRKHTTKNGFLHMGKLKHCDSYVERKGIRDYCNGKECVFWCLDCTHYPKSYDALHVKYAKGVDTLAKIKENQFPSIRVTDKLREETDKAAEIVDEKLSEYIRKAVEYRNNKVLEGK